MAEYRRRLPHFHPDGEYLFVTWRLHCPTGIALGHVPTRGSGAQRTRSLRGNQCPRAAKRTAPHSIRYVNSIAAKRPYSMRKASTGLTDEAERRVGKNRRS